MERTFTLKKDIVFEPLKLKGKELEIHNNLASYRKEIINTIQKEMGIPLHLLDVRFETTHSVGKQYLLTAHCKELNDAKAELRNR